MSTDFKHFTLAVLPFDIKPASETNNPFDFQLDCNFSDQPNAVIEFSEKLKTLSDLNSKSLIDTSRYHYHIRNLIAGSEATAESQFLKIYKIKHEHLYHGERLRIQYK